MFTINREFNQAFGKIFLGDNTTGCKAEILPSCGAILNAFEFQKDGERINVIQGYDSHDDFRNNVETKGFRGCKLSPFVCRLKDARYSWLGQNYVVDKYYSNKDALHGLIYDMRFEVEEEFAGEDCARIVLQYEYRADSPGYPFKYSCRVTYELMRNCELRLTTTITNNDYQPMPIADGWHPYFTLGGKIDEWTLQLPQAKHVLMKELIPTGEMEETNRFRSPESLAGIELDDCFFCRRAFSGCISAQ